VIGPPEGYDASTFMTLSPGDDVFVSHVESGSEDDGAADNTAGRHSANARGGCGFGRWVWGRCGMREGWVPVWALEALDEGDEAIGSDVGAVPKAATPLRWQERAVGLRWSGASAGPCELVDRGNWPNRDATAQILATEAVPSSPGQPPPPLVRRPSRNGLSAETPEIVPTCASFKEGFPQAATAAVVSAAEALNVEGVLPPPGLRWSGQRTHPPLPERRTRAAPAGKRAECPTQ